MVLLLSCNDCGEPRKRPDWLGDRENVYEQSDDPGPESIHESIPQPNDLLLVNLQLFSFGFLTREYSTRIPTISYT